MVSNETSFNNIHLFHNLKGLHGSNSLKKVSGNETFSPLVMIFNVFYQIVYGIITSFYQFDVCFAETVHRRPSLLHSRSASVESTHTAPGSICLY